MEHFRLRKLVESRIHREVYVRFGGECPKTCHSNMEMGVGCLAYIQNTVGNIFSGQVVGETAKNLSDRFGKVLQKRESMTISQNDKTTSISTQLEALIPPSKIANLSQGFFVGAVADNFDERIDQKIFHSEIVVDSEVVSKETASYEPIPTLTTFTIEQTGEDSLDLEIHNNYIRIKQDAIDIIENERQRIKNK